MGAAKQSLGFRGSFVFRIPEKISCSGISGAEEQGKRKGIIVYPD
jgi:hypothetical protein